MLRMRWIYLLLGCGGLCDCGGSTSLGAGGEEPRAGAEIEARIDDDRADWLGGADGESHRFGGEQLGAQDGHAQPAGAPGARGVRPQQVQTLGGGAAVQDRPPRVGGRNVRFHQAPLGQALGFLADAGGFNLVIQGEIGGLVSMDLFDVEPFGALLVLADAHQMSVRYRQGVVILSALGSGGAAEPRAGAGAGASEATGKVD